MHLILLLKNSLFYEVFKNHIIKLLLCLCTHSIIDSFWVEMGSYCLRT